MGPFGAKTFKDIEELRVKDFLEAYYGLRVVLGVEADGGDDERGAVGPGEFVFEGVRCCVTDVVGVQTDIEFLWVLLLGGGVVWHVVSCVE